MADQPPSQPLRACAALGLALLAPALGGGTSPMAVAVLVLGIGLVIQIAPPRRTRRGFLIGAGLLLAAGMTWALPAIHAPWRGRLVAADLPVAGLNSPQPVLSGRGWCLLAIGIAWAAWCAGQRWRTRDRKLICEGLAAGIGVIAVLALARIPVPGWPAGTGLGPFANRNQTAVLFAIGAFLTLACGAERLRGLRWKRKAGGFVVFGTVWLGMLAVYIAALGANRSRSGPIIFAAMSLAWALAVTWPWKRKAEALGVCVAVALLMGTMFLLTGHGVLARIEQSQLADFRLKIFSDTLGLIRDSPWTGVGLENFSAIFPQYRQASVLQERVLHPESDWLWLAAETGIPGLLAALGLLAWMGVRAVRGITWGEDRGLRLALCIACAGFFVHSFVDVPGHRLGTIMPALLLLGLAANAGTERPAGLLTRGLGVAIMAIGASTCTFLAFHFPTMLSENPETLAGAAKNVDTLSRIQEWAPLEWRVYAERGRLEGVHGDIVAALGDFRRANFLEPNYAWLPFDEGCYWLRISPRLTIAPWRDALRRCPSARRGEMYGQMYEAASDASPELHSELAALSAGDAELEYVALSHSTAEEFKAQFAGVLREDPGLKRFDAAQRARLITLWIANGDAAEFEAELLRYPDLLRDGYRGLAEYKAAHGDMPGAVALMQRFYPKPQLPDPVAMSRDEAMRRFAVSPDDIAAGIMLYRAAEKSGNVDEAAQILERIASQPHCPVYVHWLEGELLASQNKLAEAWKAYDQLPP